MSNLDFLEGIDKYKLDEEGKQKFKDRLITLRKKNGWSQEELGDKLDVSRQTVSKWESNDTMPEMDKLIKLSKIYNLSMDELVYGSEKVDRVDNDYNTLDDESNKLKDNLLIVENVNEENNSCTDNTDINDLPFSNVIANPNKKNALKKFIIRTFIFVIIAIIVGYLITVAYRFSVLKEINDKFNSYKNINNCYYERNEVVSNSTGTVYMINTKYWYKDGVLKMEESRTENGETKVTYTLTDTNNNVKYKLSERIKTGIRQDEFDYEFNNGIITYLIGTNYYETSFQMIKDALFCSVKNNKDNYVVEKYIDKYTKNIFNKDNAFIEQNYYVNSDKEEIKIMHNLKLGCVIDEDIKIDLNKYVIKKVDE